MAATPSDSRHPVTRVIAEGGSAVAGAVGVATWSLTPEEQRAALVDLARQQSRLAELQLRLLRQAEADDVGSASGATSTAAWHADATAQTPTQAHRLVRQAAKLHRHHDLPDAGGTNATVVVTMDLATLLGDDRAATLDTGVAVSTGKARKLACEAGIIPFVLAGTSQVLDAGRERRFHTRTMRHVIRHE